MHTGHLEKQVGGILSTHFSWAACALKPFFMPWKCPAYLKQLQPQDTFHANCILLPLQLRSFSGATC